MVNQLTSIEPHLNLYRTEKYIYSYSSGGSSGSGSSSSGSGLSSSGSSSNYAGHYGSSYGSESGVKTNTILLKNHLNIPPLADCLTSYKVPLNSHFTCEGSACKVKCYDNYEFPDHRTELTLTCIYGRWVIQETAKWKIMPDCEAICSPPCQNGGNCIAPNVCKCNNNFLGKYCEETQSICKTRPTVSNALTSCVGTATSGYRKCIVQCNRGYKLEGNIEKVDLKCLDSTTWTRSDSVDKKVFSQNCAPTCDPPCKNGGTCIAYNLCSCPSKYAGAACQYERSACNITIVAKFNGGYNCKMDSDYYNCTINCPTGIQFSSTPAPLYTCRFSEAKFYPQPVPLCKYPEGYSLTSSKYSQYQINNKETSRTHSSGYLEGEEYGDYVVGGGSSGVIKYGYGGGGYGISGGGSKYGSSVNISGGSSSFDIRGGSAGGSSGSILGFESGSSGSKVSSAIGSGLNILGFGSGGGSSSTSVRNVSFGYGIGSGGGGGISTGSSSLNILGYGSGGSSSSVKGSYAINSDLTKGVMEGVDFGLGYGGGFGYYFYNTPGTYSWSMSMTALAGSSKGKSDEGLCFTWNGMNVKTFDGVTYQSQLLCSHTMIEDSVDGTFKIVLRTCQAGVSDDKCNFALLIYWNDFECVIENVDGQMKLSTPNNKIITIPVKIVGVDITYEGRFLRIDLETVGLKILWDKNKFIRFEANKKLFGRTRGLCGTFDGDVRNDFAGTGGITLKTPRAFVDTWSVYYPEEKSCDVSREINFDMLSYDIVIKRKGETILRQLFDNNRLDNCFKVLNKSATIDFALRDYYNCPNTADRNTCACETLATLVAQCTSMGIEIKEGWRDLSTCPVKCNNGRIYNQCGPAVERTCGSATIDAKGKCVEGCFCPEGTVSHNNACVRESECPCSQGGKDFKNNAVIKQNCNTCTCKNGYWKCTENICGARCVSYGSSHFITFDGQEYDFSGKCSYVMLKTGKLVVEVEKGVVPKGSNGKFKKLPSTKWVTISHVYDGNKEIKLKLDAGKTVYKDGHLISNFPFIFGENVVRFASSNFITVELDNEIRVLWDGDSRAYIDAPASTRNKTGGLCGAFNSNTKLDFITPENDYETAVAPFVDKWRAVDSCPAIAESPMELHPCKENPHLKEKAAKYCAYLTGKLFEECHWAVCPNQFYENCMFDVCACTEDKMSDCYCPIISAYNDECSRHGIKIDSHYKIPECASKCPIGQIYEESGLICTRSCKDLSLGHVCNNETFVEGCRCPHGQLLNDQQECIEQKLCPCYYDGLNFESGYKEVRPGKYGSELCVCTEGSWICKSSKPQDINLYPPYRGNCKDKPHMEFSKCAPAEQKTCHNMHDYKENLENCKSDCICVKGYVYDRSKKRCVVPEECSCHHSGRSFEEGQSIDEACSTCKCVGGKWNCIAKPCDAVCSVWGDSHFNTFDGLSFNFQGACDYYLSKGVDANGNGFTISIQNVLCGSLGVTCSKSVKVSLSGYTSETITLSSDANIPSKYILLKMLKMITMYKSGIFQIIEDSYLGIQIKWDFGTRVYVKLANKWKGKVKGLCGDYNGDATNDMITPSGAKETRSTLFGHSWVSKDNCLMPTEPINACKEHPGRESWANLKCGILKSDVFKPCHGEISYDKYLQKCIFDSCACDQGGDCECLCTAIAAYAYECSQHGINIKWRTQHLCPMQCDSKCSSYSACVSPCPIETCDNLLDQGISDLMCKQQKCSEGCDIKPCQEGYIYSNDTYLECVPKAKCAPVCTEIKGKKYYEGDIVPSTECQTCRCSKNKVVCSGEPCVETKPLCANGWSKWLSEDEFVFESVSKKTPSFEKVPTQLQTTYGSCEKSFMKKIECRTVDSHKTPNEIGDSCTCDLINGLKCKPNAKNEYEIRVLCECDKVKEPQTAQPIGCDRAIKEYKEYEGDCYKFYHCTPLVNGTYGYVEKTCGPSMMFNPTMNICDHITNVVKLKPDCGKISPTTRQPITSIPVILPSTTIKPIQSIPKLPITTTYKPVVVPGTTKPPLLPKIPTGGDCDVNIKAYEEYKGDCQKFLHCSIQSDGTWKYVEKICGPGMFFNPTNNICDHTFSVIAIKPECGELAVPALSRESTIISVKNISEHIVELEKCPKGMKWVSCANRCKKSCHYYEKTLIREGKCGPKERCKAGCVEEALPNCGGIGKLWRDAEKCVDAEDCPCMNLDGTIVKPHQTHTEPADEFKICQCLDNQYICKEAYESVNITEEAPEITGQESLDFDIFLPKKIRIVPAIPKPITCATKKFTPIINAPVRLPDTIFSASSSKSEKHFPSYARFDSKYAWSPDKNEKSEYLQIELPHIEKIFGILTQGSPTEEEYVTLYQVLYSEDGETYHQINDKKGKQQLFSGPIDADNPVKTVLKVPIEAKILRLYPIKWHNAVSMQVELFGCDEGHPMLPTALPQIQILTTPRQPKFEIEEKTTIRPHMVTQPPLIPIVEQTYAEKITKKPYIPEQPPVRPLEKITTVKPFIPVEPEIEKITKKPFIPEQPTLRPILEKITTIRPFIPVEPEIEKVTKKPYIPEQPPTAEKTTKKPYYATDSPPVPHIVIDKTTRLPDITTRPTFKPLMPVSTTIKPYIVTEAPIVPICEDSMGVYNNVMLPQQVKGSSRATQGIKSHLPKLIDVIKLNSTQGWQPAINSPNEYVRFDFLEPRKLTGLKTLGGPLGWITAYNVLYSNDGRTWNNVLDAEGGKLFVGNQGPDILKVNYFNRPVKAQHLKIHPAKWENNINLKVEPLGCFEPYPLVPVVTEKPVTPIISNCSICPGVDELGGATCKCKLPKLWDGKTCVSSDQCPCVDNYITYPVGAKFETRDCEECVCVLGGVKQCTPKKCPPCAKGLRHVNDQKCLCLCESCPPDTRICPTSGDCIKKSEWCDGIKNCEDDEDEECDVEPIIPVTKKPKLEAIVCTWQGKTYGINEKWTSNDSCTTYICKEINNIAKVDSYSVTCPLIDCDVSLQYKDGCCLKCKPKPEEKCSAVPMENKDTIKLIAYYDKQHSLCINKEPIVGFTHCVGSCPSGTKYSKVLAKHQSYCDCCGIQKFKVISVPLICEDGYKMNKEIEVPETCKCSACTG
ncbi:uncharacterized protein LOC129609258 [Condylostylus longicornis]|uniref:uncharacterized protein LOC129609258 n=1 Tax=Condylostylus longicornis TaxID=2530218 RepID=UPI00244DE6E3|nr:uncharacterized protein LOC129609258 [Condylostylus longicornis]